MVKLIAKKQKRIACQLCGKVIRSKQGQKYCPECSYFALRVNNLKVPPLIKKYLLDYVRQYGFVCYYTGMKLDVSNFRSPWYCSFDHVKPGINDKVVLTSTLLNVIKTDMTDDEFWYYVLQLDNHRRHHLKVRKKKIIYWNRLLPTTPRIHGKKCSICNHPVYNNHSKYCLFCARLATRMKFKRFSRQAIESVWAYVRQYGRVCYYTGMKLDVKNPKSPWYLTFDHWNPQDDRKIVLTSMLLNDMKSDLTEAEFWFFISELANHHRKGSMVRKRKLRYWDRNYRSKIVRAGLNFFDNL